jgi:hypothetical protein
MPLLEKLGRHHKLPGVSGGARRNRTADLFNAIEALSQLSYDPGLSEIGRIPAKSAWVGLLPSAVTLGAECAAAV